MSSINEVWSLKYSFWDVNDGSRFCFLYLHMSSTRWHCLQIGCLVCAFVPHFNLTNKASLMTLCFHCPLIKAIHTLQHILTNHSSSSLSPSVCYGSNEKQYIPLCTVNIIFSCLINLCWQSKKKKRSTVICWGGLWWD